MANNKKRFTLSNYGIMSSTMVHNKSINDTQIIKKNEHSFKLKQKEYLKYQKEHDKELYKIMFGAK